MTNNQSPSMKNPTCANRLVGQKRHIKIQTFDPPLRIKEKSGIESGAKIREQITEMIDLPVASRYEGGEAEGGYFGDSSESCRLFETS